AIALLAVFGAILFLFFYINKKHQENIILSEDMRAAADIYVDLERIDFRSDRLECIKQREDGAGFVQKASDSFSQTAERICSEMAAEQSKEILKSFLDIGSICERLKEANVLSHEFMDTKDQWIRTRFIVMDRDETGEPPSIPQTETIPSIPCTSGLTGAPTRARSRRATAPPSFFMMGIFSGSLTDYARLPVTDGLSLKVSPTP
ncbi:MAG: hypothetical protein J5966_08320, partial [Lachnospiraceae bacterium]|nr:hypothetical protein [Lachnospiraceae bacterium]